MKVVDANVLLYAVNEDAGHHTESVTWLDRALAGEDSVGFVWVVMLAFLRLATKPGLFPHPLTTSDAVAQLTAWTTAPGAVVLHPGPDHAQRLADLLSEVGAGGNLVNDAHLAALALEHRADVVSFDHGFARFPGLRWHRPRDLKPT